MVIRRARDLFFPNVLVCVELREARVLFLERSMPRHYIVRFVADLFLMRCTTTFHLTPLMVPSLRGSALSMLSIHALGCTLSFSLTIGRWIFRHFVASPTNAARDASGRERCSVGRLSTDTAACFWTLGSQPASLPQGYSRHHASAAARSFALTHLVPYDSERRAAKRHRETTGLPTLAKDNTEISYIIFYCRHTLWPFP
jgi:hypothetical protein